MSRSALLVLAGLAILPSAAGIGEILIADGTGTVTLEGMNYAHTSCSEPVAITLTADVTRGIARFDLRATTEGGCLPGILIGAVRSKGETYGPGGYPSECHSNANDIGCRWSDTSDSGYIVSRFSLDGEGSFNYSYEKAATWVTPPGCCYESTNATGTLSVR